MRIINCQLLTAFFGLPIQADWWSSRIWLCLAASIISVALTGALVRVAAGRGWVVLPRENRWSRRVVAQFGGVPIFLAFWSASLFLPHSPSEVLLLLCTAVLCLMGLVDDFRGLGPKPKLSVELLLAGLMVYAGVVYPLTPNVVANQILTLLWIAGVTNAFNLIDNMDGLAAGVGAIVLGAISLIAGVNSSLGLLALLLLISMGGFLLFNLHPARVFMGDVGSLPVGFFLACASVMVCAKLPRHGTVALAPALLLVVPLYDVLLVSVTRPLNGRSIADGARDHTSHRLVLLGMRETGAVRLLHGIALAAGVLALWLVQSSSRWPAVFVTLFGVALALMWSGMAAMELPEDWLSRRPGRILRIPAIAGRWSGMNWLLSRHPILSPAGRPAFRHDRGGAQDEAGTASQFAPLVAETGEAELKS